MKIYTKTGDQGETSLIGKRISKDAEILDVIGTLDELNSSIGIIISTIDSDSKSKQILSEVHKELEIAHNKIFTLSSILAGAKLEADFSEWTEDLEKKIDNFTSKLEPLSNFILPGGSLISAHIHYTRTIARKSERIFVGYTNVSESRPISFKEMRKYLNRLSDFLFTLARYCNKELGVEDKIWDSQPDVLRLGI